MVTDPEIQLSPYLIIHNPIANRHPCLSYAEFATAFQTKNELALYRGAKARQKIRPGGPERIPPVTTSDVSHNVH